MMRDIDQKCTFKRQLITVFYEKLMFIVEYFS